jgi:uncharacterized protein
MLGSRIDMGELAELAARKACREMRIDSRDLPRLAQLVAGHDQSSENAASKTAGLTTGVQFGDGPEGFPRVQLTITGCVNLECQRCLRPFECPVDIDTVLTVLNNEDQADQVEDSFDIVLIDTDGLNINAVIEDEILAALPMAPVHGPGSECVDLGQASIETKTDTVQMHRPFDELASLMKRADKK